MSQPINPALSTSQKPIKPPPSMSQKPIKPTLSTSQQPIKPYLGGRDADIWAHQRVLRCGNPPPSGRGSGAAGVQGRYYTPIHMHLYTCTYTYTPIHMHLYTH
jgi:hypothetical protein